MKLFGYRIGGKREEAAKPKPSEERLKVVNRTVTVNPNTAVLVAAYSHALALRAETFSRGVLEYQTHDRIGDVWRKATYGDKRNLNYLLHVRPNERQNARQMWTAASIIRDNSETGTCCIYAPGLTYGEVRALYPCRGAWNYLDNTYTLTSAEHQISATVPASECIVLRNCYGKSMATILSRSLSLAATCDQFSTETLGKGGTFRAIVRQEAQQSPLMDLASLDDEQVQTNVDNIAKQLREQADLIYDPTASQITPITQSFQDLQAVQLKASAVEDVARVMRVPLPLMFVNSNAVYKSIDDAWHTFRELTIQPMWEELAQEFNGKFLVSDDYGKSRFWVNGRHLCLDSDKGKADTIGVLVASGIVAPNEARHLYNLPPVDGGDKLSQKQNKVTQDGDTDATTN